MKITIFMIVAALPLLAQDPTPSLAERARQIREAKAKSGAPKATRVITNDEMKAATPTAETKEKTVDEKSAEAKPAGKEKATPASLVLVEKKYHEQSAKLHNQLKQAEVEAQKLKDDMAAAAPNSVTVTHYYYDPTRLKALQAAIDKNNELIDSLHKQIDALKDEVHSKGYPDSWADPE
jgi:hypothetical protein